ncbi:MAG: hypothetical protein ACW98U_16455, partial [Candidatus Thorarchaeota archaeon]
MRTRNEMEWWTGRDSDGPYYYVFLFLQTTKTTIVNMAAVVPITMTSVGIETTGVVFVAVDVVVVVVNA